MTHSRKWRYWPALVPLYRDKGYAKVDPECMQKLAPYSWHLTCKGYAATSKVSGGTLFMHRLLLDAPPDKQVDHINGDKLDNRLCNLRLATNSENCRTKRKANPTGYRGISFKKAINKWQASIMIDGKRKYLGVYETPEQAAEAYKKAAVELYGEFQPIDGKQFQEAS